jgi:hypothetical protein
MAERADIGVFFEDLQAAGRYSFTDAEARAAVGSSAVGSAAALRRLRAARRMVTPRRGFHVIVPPEYRDAGAPPASWFIDDLMRYVGRGYYVGLLSAAAVHGAAHQQPMRFQVVTSAPLRPAAVGRVHIDFHVSRSVESTPTLQVQTDTGYMRVSTAEVTAFDLVRYAGASGGVSNVATVLSELAERLQVDQLRSVAATRPTPQIQRLGCLLDFIDRQGLADPLLRALTGRRVRPVSLTGRPVSLTARPRTASAPAPEPPWRVIVDESVEVDA